MQVLFASPPLIISLFFTDEKRPVQFVRFLFLKEMMSKNSPLGTSTQSAVNMSGFIFPQ
jgi:hypothetical protein